MPVFQLLRIRELERSRSAATAPTPPTVRSRARCQFLRAVSSPWRRFGSASLVEVTSDSGSIRVVGDDEESVRVVIRLEEGWSRIERVARVDGDRLVLSAACPVFSGPFCSATYEVHVPRRLDVVARSENADVGASDVDGAVTAGSSNGDVAGTRLGGEAELTTDNGSVEGIDLTGEEVVASSSNAFNCWRCFDIRPLAVAAAAARPA